MNRTLGILLGSLVLPSGAYAEDAPKVETPAQPLAMGCFLDRMVSSPDRPGIVKRKGKPVQIFVLIQDSPETSKSIVLDSDDRSRVLSGAKFSKFDYVPENPSRFMVWTTDIADPNNILLQVDMSKADHENAVMAKHPDDPSFRFMGSCLSLRSKDSRADYQHMKAFAQ